MKEVVIYDMISTDIPDQDMPPVGHIVVCKDQFERMGPEPHVVYEVASVCPSTGKAKLEPRGAFGIQENAVIFAKAYADK
jgi:hypothetical protein